LRWQGDEGAPLVVADPSHILSALFLDTASEIWRLLND
jgi:hypothetical protein